MTQNTREIPLTQGKVAIVDSDDYEWLSQFKWHAHRDNSGFYAARSAVVASPRKTMMHRQIMNPHECMIVDHINRDGLDNRRANLRLATLNENARNRASERGSSSQYLGVSWNKASGKWMVRIRCEYGSKFLGMFADEIEAALAYDAAARSIHGEFANPNFGQTP